MMGIGMAVRPPRQLSLMARALSAIRRNGGTAFYVPDDMGLVLGPELVSNGDFSAGTTGWSGVTGVWTSTVASVGGVLRVYATGTAGGWSGAISTITGLTVGKTYRLAGDFVAQAGWASFSQSNLTVLNGGSAVASLASRATAGAFVPLAFVAPSTTLEVRTRVEGVPNGAASTADFDNISVREILTATTYIDSTGTQPVAAIGDLVGLLTDRSYGTGNLGVERNTATTLATGATFSILVFPEPMPNRAFEVRNAPAGLSWHDGVNVRPLNGLARQIITNQPGASVCNLFQSTGSTMDISMVSVREVLGNHATQPTTASKPVVTRVPKRLGPNLVVNGGFDSGTTGWVASNAELTVVSGALRITNTTASPGNAKQTVPVVAGRGYQISWLPTAGGAISCGSTNSGSDYVALSGGLSTTQFRTFTAVGASAFIALIVNSGTSGATADWDNITVQEVLEWTPALKFDGSNDSLTLSSGAILQQGSDHFVTVAGRLDAGAGGWRQIYGSRNAASFQAVAAISYNGSHNRLTAEWIDNTNAIVALSESVSSKGQFFVATAAKIGNTRSFWVNGVLQGTSSASLGATTVTSATIGASQEEGTTRNYWSGEVPDIAIGQSTLTEADRKTIERNMAQKAGVTYVG